MKHTYLYNKLHITLQQKCVVITLPDAAGTKANPIYKNPKPHILV